MNIEWENAIGSAQVVTTEKVLAEYTENVSGLERTIQAVWYPNSTEDVQKIVRFANQYHIALHPISSGKNWGLGDRLPVENNAAIVDLKNMNKIHKVDTVHGYAVIEPGVTQKQLYEYLRDKQLPFIINVTGAGAETTFVGNAMDRGIGYYGSRAESIYGMEVVLGNGNILQTGFGHYPQAKSTYLYPYGIGPDLNGLFFQSNFGITTKVGMELIPHYDEHAYLSCSLIDANNLEKFVDTLAHLRKRNIISSSFHISNSHRVEINACPLLYKYFLDLGFNEVESKERALKIFAKIKSCWSASCGLLGTKVQIKEAYTQTQKSLKKIAHVHLITASKIKQRKQWAQITSFLPNSIEKKALLHIIMPPFGHSKGIPSNDALNSIFWPLGEKLQNVLNPAQSNCGKLYILPIVPMDGTSFREVVGLTENIIFNKYGFTPYITMNMAKDKAFESVINLAFKRNIPSEVEKAHSCIKELQHIFVEAGYIPYRMGIQTMKEMIHQDDYHWQIVADLKKIFDPNDIISPGRYNLKIKNG